jgi:regulator of extracellular matrix RemA (YlzA/DUF370 family)
MTEQFRRAYTLEVGEALESGSFSIVSAADALRVAFEIERDELPWPNKAQIRIWNLSPTHREYLSSAASIPCRLEAGYAGSVGTIFEGAVRQGISTHDGSDWVTTLEAGEGDLTADGEHLAQKSIKKSWKRGTPVAAIVTDFAKEMNVDLGNVPILAAAASFSNGPALLHGLAVDGPILDEFTYLLRGLGMRWSIQGNAIQLRLADAPANVMVGLISPFTGLVGRVVKSTKQVRRQNSLTKKRETQEIAVVEGKTLLTSALQPGYQFVLQSDEASGAYLCAKTVQRGDTRDTAWFTEFEGYG